MPLTKSSSEIAFKSNFKAELAAGKPKDQALAIAYDVKRRSRATGGRVVDVAGLKAKIENERGSVRSKVGRDGKRWSVTMPDHYGHIQRTEGSDGDHVDCYIGKDLKSDKVYIIDQLDAETGKFDEHKCMLGYPDQKTAARAYEAAFSDGKGKQRIGSITELSVDRFRDWLKSGQTRKPMSNGIIKRAAGGQVPWFVKQEASHLGKTPIVGPVRSASPGRADKLGARVHAGSYVLPSQSIAHLGQGNTESGFHVADKMFHAAPAPKLTKLRADGGGVKEPDPIEILISGGEYVVHPDKVREIGDGDLDRGHEVLDHFVKEILKNEKKEVASLPGPAQGDE